jgi:hypothetical protein
MKSFAHAVVVLRDGKYNVWFQLMHWFAVGITWNLDHVTNTGAPASMAGVILGPLWITVTWKKT